MDLRLKAAAILGWVAGLVLTFLIDDHPAPALTVGCFIAAACFTVCVSMRTVARHTRRAFYRQCRWDDTPEATVLQLLRRPDAIDRPAQRPLASRSSQTATPMVPHVQHKGFS